MHSRTRNGQLHCKPDSGTHPLFLLLTLKQEMSDINEYPCRLTRWTHCLTAWTEKCILLVTLQEQTHWSSDCLAWSPSLFLPPTYNLCPIHQQRPSALPSKHIWNLSPSHHACCRNPGCPPLIGRTSKQTMWWEEASCRKSSSTRKGSKA